MHDTPEHLVVEYAPFRVRPGITEAEVRRAAAALQAEFVAARPGFVRRELLRAGERDYVDLIWWRSEADAQAVVAAAADSPACARFFALLEGAVDDPGAGIQHFTQLDTFVA